MKRKRFLNALNSFALTCFLGLSIGACSSQQQDQEDLETEQGQQEYGEQQGQQEYGEGQQEYGEGQQEQGYGQEAYGEETGEALGEDPYGAAAGGANELTSLVEEASQAEGGDPLATDNYALPDEVPAAPLDGGYGTTSLDEPIQMAAPALAVKGAAGMPAGPGLPELGSKMAYVVESGDTLARISEKIYQTTARWKELASLSGFPNPDRIYPGDIVYYQLTEEAVAFATTYEATPKQEVTSQAGDTLASISQAVFGHTKHWKEIWRQNGHIDDPFNIAPGTAVFYLVTGTATASIDSMKNVDSDKLAVRANLKSLSKKGFNS